MNPKHYADCLPNWEPIDVIERYGLCFHLGNALKYIVRCKRKGEYITDLHKALYYVTRYQALEIWSQHKPEMNPIEYEKIAVSIIDNDSFRLKDLVLQDIAHGIVLGDSDVDILIKNLIEIYEEGTDC